MRSTSSILLVMACIPLSLAAAPLVPPATQPARGPIIVVPASQPSSAAEQAANEIAAYLAAHRDELQPKLAAVNFSQNGAPEEYQKLKALLPTLLADKVDLAVPVLHQRQINEQIAVNLRYIGSGLNEYLGQNHDALPENLGQLVSLVPSVNVFFAPDTKLPDEVAHGTPDQQAPWINMHTMFAFPAAGTKPGATPPLGVLAYERLDLNPEKSQLAVLYGDGHVDTASRADLEKALKLR